MYKLSPIERAFYMVLNESGCGLKAEEVGSRVRYNNPEKSLSESILGRLEIVGLVEKKGDIYFSVGGELK